MSVTEQITGLHTGEVDARMLAAEVDEMLPREILDRIFAAVRAMLEEACSIGWSIWREDYHGRQAMRRVEAQRQQLLHQRRRLNQQQDIRNYGQLRPREA